MSLREHVARAREILSVGGVRTILPGIVPLARGRVDFSDRQRDYALSVLLPVQKHDRTGWALAYLSASRETAAATWQAIPQALVCPACLTPGRSRPCARCGRRLQPHTLRGLVGADLASIRRALRLGGIVVR